MRKLDRRAQYERSQKNDKGRKEEDKGRGNHMSRRAIERKAREMQATKRSMKTVSEIVVESSDENVLLELVAELQGIKLVEKSEDLPRLIESDGEDEENHDSDSSSSDSSSSESEEESDGVMDEQTSIEERILSDQSPSKTPHGKVMLKSSFMRKLVRDDRRARRDLLEGNNPTSEKIAAKIRRTIQNNSTKDILKQQERRDTSDASMTPSSSSAKEKAAAPVSQTIRMSIACPKRRFFQTHGISSLNSRGRNHSKD